jgi:hypothetical protein
MTDGTPLSAARSGDATARRMRAIAAELTAAGLTAQLHDTQGVLDIAAALHRPRCKRVEVIVDEDGYVQISYWNDPAATPSGLVAVINRALTSITTGIGSR